MIPSRLNIPNNVRRPRRGGRGGMTIIELSIGLIITSMIVAALGAFWFAVAQTWTQNSGLQATTLTASHATARIEQTMREAKYLLQYRAGSLNAPSPASGAQVFFWHRDFWNKDDPAGKVQVNDGSVQMAELALLEHDPVNRRLYLYEAMSPAQMNPEQQGRAGQTIPWSDLTATSTPAAFKSCDFVRKQVFCEAVDGAVFNIPAWGRTIRPGLEFTLRLSRDGDKSVIYGMVSLRGPATRPS
jgi:hypothetical protein